MKQLIFILFLSSLNTNLYSQKYDYQWAFGYGSNLDNSFGVSIIDFNDGVANIYPYLEVPGGIKVSNSGSFICDKTGELLLITDNCRIMDKNLRTIENGKDMNPGPTNNDFCDDFSYPAHQSAIILPEISSDSIFYVIHKDSEIWAQQQDVVSKKLYLSVIVQRIDGTFYVKEKITLLDENMIVNRLTAGINHSKDKWWIYTIGYNSNQYNKFLIGGQKKYEGPFVQEIGPIQTNTDLEIGQTTFSPDGNSLALNSAKYGLILFDFDNETGELSNYRNIEYPNMDSCEGLCFSPNSKFVYVTWAEECYQIDLENEEVIFIAQHYEPGEDGWPVGMGFMSLAPDCRIYVSPGTSNFYLHTILYPNRKGKDCEFVERAFRTPTNVSFDLPNIPMYRIDGNCDSTIRWTGTVDVVDLTENKNVFFCFPNPADEIVNFQIPQEFSKANYAIFNSMGQLIEKVSNEAKETKISIHTAKYPNGLYLIKQQEQPKVFFKFRVQH